MSRPLSVAVCACTYKRPAGLRALLEGLGKLTFDCFREVRGSVPQITVVVADNEGSATVRELCAEFQKHSGTPLTYVYEPERGIPYARNACLSHVPDACDFICFIDDDEVPKEDWLDQLLLAQKKANADVVAGKVIPVFAEGTSAWIKNGGFFGSPRRSLDLDLPRRSNLQVLACAATNNVLVRMAAVRRLDLCFDTAFAFSGGSDAFFFRTLHEAGCRIVFAERAIVYDHIPASRATLRYMCRERFRVANNNVLIDALIDGKSRPARSRALYGAKHVGLGVRRIAKTLIAKKPSADRLAVGAFHMAHGLGVITAAFGYRYQHYK